MLFAKKSTYLEGSSTIGSDDKEADVRFDINSPSMQNVFKYITALPPSYVVSTDARGRVRGRININTAPKFVIEQLPWVKKANGRNLKIAEAIVAYRDKLDISPAGPNYYHDKAANARAQETGITNIYESPGFRSVGELLTVINQSSGKNDYNIRYCGIDGYKQYSYPRLYNPDANDTNIKDDLEEKELIFTRISDLATVRSDTFTAYILVRVGTKTINKDGEFIAEGPQKRFIAILDRTGVTKAGDKVKVAAFQQVPAAK
jgi:hypothetical protein